MKILCGEGSNSRLDQEKTQGLDPLGATSTALLSAEVSDDFVPPNLNTPPKNGTKQASVSGLVPPSWPVSDIAGGDFRRQFFPSATASEWCNWRWQIKNRLMSVQELDRIVRLSADERNALTMYGKRLPVAITPYYSSLLRPDDPKHPLRRTVIPVSQECFRSPDESPDPLGEKEDSPVPGLVHRYPDRALFLVTNRCATYCRYCARSRIVGKNGSFSIGQDQWEHAIDYIETTPDIRDVLISGGDPLTLPDSKLEWLLARLRKIPHVEILRIGTKAPVVLPQRVTLALARMLERYHPLWMSIHFTHPDELTSEVYEACTRLADAGIPLGSQTVLLSGVNDNVETTKRLFQGLLRMRVRPYYLYQCDPIVGSAHFRTHVSRGLEIIQGLGGHTTGYAVPQYVIDAPGGGGKIPICPETVVGREESYLLLKNYEGKVYRYPDPIDTPCKDGESKKGDW